MIPGESFGDSPAIALGVVPRGTITTETLGSAAAAVAGSRRREPARTSTHGERQ